MNDDNDFYDKLNDKEESDRELCSFCGTPLLDVHGKPFHTDKDGKPICKRCPGATKMKPRGSRK